MYIYMRTYIYIHIYLIVHERCGDDGKGNNEMEETPEEVSYEEEEACHMRRRRHFNTIMKWRKLLKKCYQDENTLRTH
jgi:hypothetical protein